ncbi:MAG: hypothetical protein KF749_13015 [Bacteroidetes bacterium]|nr:hypothetical protein [Bacteroidota bacterium]MCW5894384.1 hypothetical protein [Bacteroidota bacterium]
MKTKRAFTFVLCFHSVQLAASAQDKPATQSKDTTRSEVSILDPGISFGKPTFVLPPLLTLTPGDFSEELHITAPSTPPPFLSSSVVEKIDLLSPLKLQRAREDDLSTLRTILGTVQLGGVAYLAYRHLKKYGFK